MALVKKISPFLVILLLFASQSIAFGEIRWNNNLEEATRLARQTNRLILVHFWADWCKPCIRLEREVFSQATVANTMESHFVPVKLHADSNASLAKRFGVDSLPTDVILSPNGELLAKYNSPSSATAYIQKMGQVAASRTLPANSRLARDLGAPPSSNPYLAVSQSLAPSAATNGSATRSAYPVQGSANGLPPSNNPYASAASSQPGNQHAAPASYGPAPPTNNYGAATGAFVPQASNAPHSGGRYGESSRYSPQSVSNVAGAVNTPGPQSIENRYVAGNQVAGSAGDRYGQRNFAVPQATSTPPQANTSYTPDASRRPPLNANRPVSETSFAPAYRQGPGPTSVAQPQAAASQNGFGLDGYCPVTLTEGTRWVQGDKRYGAVHRGRTYLFIGPAEQQRFLANPDSFSPVLSGNDPVLVIDQNQVVTGNRRHGVFYRDQVYLFSSEESLQRFGQNPQRYANGVQQAMNHPTGQIPRR